MLFLNVDLVKASQAVEQATNFNDLVQRGEVAVDWFICPTCHWVGRAVVKTSHYLIKCPRPDEPPFHIAAVVHGWKKKRCVAAVPIHEMAPRLVDTWEAVLRLKGTNPLIEMFQSLGPIEVGLDDPGGTVSAAYSCPLGNLRPDSVDLTRRGLHWERKSKKI